MHLYWLFQSFQSSKFGLSYSPFHFFSFTRARSRCRILAIIYSSFNRWCSCSWRSTSRFRRWSISPCRSSTRRYWLTTCAHILITWFCSRWQCAIISRQRCFRRYWIIFLIDNSLLSRCSILWLVWCVVVFKYFIEIALKFVLESLCSLVYFNILLPNQVLLLAQSPHHHMYFDERHLDDFLENQT